MPFSRDVAIIVVGVLFAEILYAMITVVDPPTTKFYVPSHTSQTFGDSPALFYPALGQLT